MMRTRLPWLLPLLLILPACGKDADQPDLVPVTGRVTLGGQALSGANVIFIPSGETRGTKAEGRTDADGNYRLKTQSDRHGTPTGEYRVIILKYVLPDGSDYVPPPGEAPIDSPARPLLTPSYSEPDETILKKTVPPGGGTIDLPLPANARRK